MLSIDQACFPSSSVPEGYFVLSARGFNPGRVEPAFAIYSRLPISPHPALKRHPLPKLGEGAEEVRSACGRADKCALPEAVEGVNGDGGCLAVEIDLEGGGGFDAGGFW